MISIVVFNLYIPKNCKDKYKCYKSLMNLKYSKFSMDCIILGDFNVTIRNFEKGGGRISRDYFRENLEDLIRDWDLMDVNLIKGRFTCSNKIMVFFRITTRLDCFLVHRNLLLQHLNL